MNIMRVGRRHFTRSQTATSVVQEHYEIIIEQVEVIAGQRDRRHLPARTRSDLLVVEAQWTWKRDVHAVESGIDDGDIQHLRHIHSSPECQRRPAHRKR